MRLATVIVCDLNRDAERERFLRSILFNNARTPWFGSVDYGEAPTIQERWHPRLVLVDLGQNTEKAMAVIAFVRKETPERYVIAIGSSKNSDLVPRIVELGATDILSGDDIPSELEAAVEKIWKSRNKTIA
jgi:DNA-binding NarL/FixJ family response regulator